MYSALEQQYLSLLKSVLLHGETHDDRTGTGTIRLFGPQIYGTISSHFPLLTTKFVPLRLVFEELMWFLRGETNIKSLQDLNVHIWDEWADAAGELGPVYGKMWRDFNGVDQIQYVLDCLTESPNSRRVICSAWHPKHHLPGGDAALPPCHMFFQCYVSNGELSLKMYQRSADMFLGVPFNIASYVLLMYILAWATDLKPKTYYHTFGDAHIYNNHVDQVNLQLRRPAKEAPKLRFARQADPVLSPLENILSLRWEDIILEGYNPHPAIKGDVAV